MTSTAPMHHCRSRPGMLRRPYDWTLHLAGCPRAELTLGEMTSAENSFFPILPSTLLMPMVLTNQARA